MQKSKNNKGKPAGSGTVSNARRERYKKACQERDKFLESSTDLEAAKELQRAQQKKQLVKDDKKEEVAPCQKEQQADLAPCKKEQDAQKEPDTAPCQKEQAKKQQVVDGANKKTREDAAPCQKEQSKEQQVVEVKGRRTAGCFAGNGEWKRFVHW